MGLWLNGQSNGVIWWNFHFQVNLSQCQTTSITLYILFRAHPLYNIHYKNYLIFHFLFKEAIAKHPVNAVCCIVRDKVDPPAYFGYITSDAANRCQSNLKFPPKWFSNMSPLSLPQRAQVLARVLDGLHGQDLRDPQGRLRGVLGRPRLLQGIPSGSCRLLGHLLLVGLGYKWAPGGENFPVKLGPKW